MDKAQKNRIKNFSLVILVLALLFLLVSGYSSYKFELNNQRKNFVEVGYHFTKLIDDSFNALVQSDAQRLQSLSTKDAMVDYCNKSIKSTSIQDVELLMESMLRENKNLLYLRISEIEGTGFVEHKLYDELDYDLSSVSSTSFNGNKYIVTDVFNNENLSEQLYVIACPIYFESELVGIVQAVYDFSFFSDIFIRNVAFGKTGYVFFVTSEGELLDHPLEENIVGLKKDAKTTISELLEIQENDIKVSEFRGKEKLYYIKNITLKNSIQGIPLYIIFTQEAEEIFNYTKTNMMRTTTVIVILLILFIILIVLSGHKVTNLVARDVRIELEESLDTEVKRRTKKLKKLAETDSLTKLYNHGTIIRKVEMEIKKVATYSDTFTILMIDIDHFKRINDTYGHLIGDEVLVMISQQLRRSIRTNDIVGRYGGEEFLVMLRNIGVDSSYLIADRIRELISELKFSYSGIKITVSIGMAEWNNHSSSEVIKLADTKLYESKSLGRNRTSK